MNKIGYSFEYREGYFEAENILKISDAGYVRMSAGGYHYIVCTDEVWEDIERILDEREDEE